MGHPILQVHRHEPVFCIQIRLDTQLQRPNTSHYRHTIIQNNVELRRVRRVLYENDEKSINDKIQRQASWKTQWNRTSRSVDISAVVNANVYDTCVNNEQNSSRQGGIVVYTDVENALEDLDPEGVKF